MPLIMEKQVGEKLRTQALLRREDKVDDAIREAQLIPCMINEWELWRFRIETNIASLKNQTERIALRLKYLHNADIDDIADTLHYSQRQTYRILEAATRHLDEVLKNPEP